MASLDSRIERLKCHGMVPKEEQKPRKAPVATERVWEMSDDELVLP
jgi:hypothetical protein